MADSMTVTLAHKTEWHSSVGLMRPYYVRDSSACKQNYHVAPLNALRSDTVEFVFCHEELSLSHCATNGLREVLRI
jgi:hypothetical protein